MTGGIMTVANELGAGVSLETEAGEVWGGWVLYECQETTYQIGDLPSVDQSLPGECIR